MELINLIFAQPKTPLIVEVIGVIVAYTATYKYTMLIKPVNYIKSYLVACFMMWFYLGLVVKFWFIQFN